MVMRSGYLASGPIVDPQSADKEEYHAAEYTYYYAGHKISRIVHTEIYPRIAIEQCPKYYEEREPPAEKSIDITVARANVLAA